MSKTEKRDITKRYSALKRRCKYLGRVFDIPFDVYESRLKAGCSYCGCNILNEKGGGMDRRNSDVFDYTVENTRSCCAECNNIKGVLLTEGEMEHVAKALDEYRCEHGYVKPENRMAMARKKRKAGVL